ncbi:hypothetical protein [Lentibacillus jeotgali]|uniref:hypothetical protein n=1 Tax=Lentibacillus jeotgali TaxID=558169 RepID=UPI000262706C|nr:hypothetical protein [Lentibacillus jeotgali]
MKKAQSIFAIPSLSLFFIFLLLNYRTGVFISLGVILIALIIRQIRLQKYTYILGHPDRHARYNRSDDLLDQAETYVKEYEKEDNSKK